MSRFAKPIVFLCMVSLAAVSTTAGCPGTDALLADVKIDTIATEGNLVADTIRPEFDSSTECRRSV